MGRGPPRRAGHRPWLAGQAKLVHSHDRRPNDPPAAQRTTSQRTGSTGVEVAASHSVYLSHRPSCRTSSNRPCRPSPRSSNCGPISTAQIICSIRSRRQKQHRDLHAVVPSNHCPGRDGIISRKAPRNAGQTASPGYLRVRAADAARGAGSGGLQPDILVAVKSAGSPAGALCRKRTSPRFLISDFGDAVVVSLLFVGGLDDSRRHGMVRLGRY